MPRKSEIAADARALYGPPSVRPAAGDMGDGALWVDPGDSQSLWQVQSGNWRQIALPPADVDTDDDSSVPAGIPILRGPYVVSFSDIPHDGDTLTLWTPAVGEVLLMIGGDPTSAVVGGQGGLPLDAGGLDLGTAAEPQAIMSNIEFTGFHASGAAYQLPWVFTAVSPMQVRWVARGDADLTAGHVALFALIARPVAP